MGIKSRIASPAKKDSKEMLAEKLYREERNYRADRLVEKWSHVAEVGKGITKMSTTTARNLAILLENQARVIHHMDESLFSSAFYGCTALINIEIPLVTTIYEYAFQNSNLKTVTFPKVRSLSQNVFYDNVNLREANLPQLHSIDTGTFYNCARLIKIFISQTDKVCTLIHKNAFTKCYHILGTGHEIYNPRAIKDGYIYVPASLLSQYKVAQNWTTYASQIIGHEDLEEGATLRNYTTSSFTKQT